MSASYPSLYEAQALPDPAQNWQWVCSIILPDDSIIDRLRVLDVNFPFRYFDITPRYRAGGFLHFPHHKNVNTCTITFYETQDYFITNLVESWMDLICDSNGNYGVPYDYLGMIILTCFDDEGDPTLTVSLTGAWPHLNNDWNLSYQASDHMPVSVVFSVNDVIFNNQPSTVNSPGTTGGTGSTNSTSNSTAGSGAGAGTSNSISSGGNSIGSAFAGGATATTPGSGGNVIAPSNSNTAGGGYVDVPATGTPQPGVGQAGGISITP